MGYVKTFNSFNKAEEKQAAIGANPTKIEEDGAPTNPQLLTQYSALQNIKAQQNQLALQKAELDKKVLDLQTAYDKAVQADQTAKKNAEATTQVQPAVQPSAQPAVQPAAQPTQSA